MHRLTRPHGWILLLATAIAPAAAQTQTGNSQAYVPAVPAGTTVGNYGGYYGGGHASTAAEGSMNGMANVLSAAGDYNLSTSAAAVNMTQAERTEIQNRQLYTNTYFEMRAVNNAARAQEAGSKPTMEQLARIARQGVPEALQSDQLNTVTGQLFWPPTLSDEMFSSPRTTVDELFAKRAAQGNLGISDQSALRQALESMTDELKAHIREIEPQFYVDSKNFLRSVAYVSSQRPL